MSPPSRGVCVCVLLFSAVSGRLFTTTTVASVAPDGATSMAGEFQKWLADRNAEADTLVEQLRARLGERLGAEPSEKSQQPAFAGAWRTAKYDNLEDFLERAMGVGMIKRKVAAKATQMQKLHVEGGVVMLEISDQRGTVQYTLRPDGKVYNGKGFQRLPIKQRAKWARDGSLLVEERYSQHLGGAEHGQKCSGSACPVVHSRRYFDKSSGNMFVELERTLLSGETVRTRTTYETVA